MRFFAICVWLAILFMPTAHANVDLIPPGQTTIAGGQVTINALVENESVVCNANLTAERILSIFIDWKGHRLTVPVSEFGDLSQPQIESLQLTYGYPRIFVGTKARPEPQIQVRLKYDPLLSNEKQSEFREASFIFFDGKYVERWTRELMGIDKWQHTRKQLGMPVGQAGVESVISPPLVK